jgi:hypothetical protein
MPLSTRLRKLVEGVISFLKRGTTGLRRSNSQVAASCESIVDTTMQDADFGVKGIAVL